MALYNENFPYVNAHGLNLDWILKKVKELETTVNELNTQYPELLARITANDQDNEVLHRDLNNVLLRLVNDESLIDALQGSVTTITNNITTINNAITEIQEELEGIDLQALEDLVNDNNIASINRDNALSARISQLERATLHDVYNYYSDGNMLIFGSDLRNLPSTCKEGGFPKRYGNRLNKHLAVGTDTARAWKLTTKGFEVDTTNSSYDYYQMGQFPPSLGVVDSVTVTFAVSTGGDATPSAWYSHTFLTPNEQWTIRSGCVVRFGTFLDGDNTVYTVQFMGTPANWLNVVPNGSCIPFIYVEYGTGSVDTSATSKPKFCSKDRQFFETNEAVIPAPSNFAQNITQDIDAFYYDAVGDPVSYKLPTTSNIRVWWFNKMLSGFITINCRPTSTASGVTQLDGINENGCYAEYDLALTDSTIPNVGFNCHFPVFDMIGNKQGEAYLAKAESDTNMTKVHIKLSSTGFVIDGVTDKYLQIPFSALLQ